ncbi:MAG: cyanophycinase [Burkholderiales bacterium]|nr:cyanophycinase [Anaerolineae bacterium]
MDSLIANPDLHQRGYLMPIGGAEDKTARMVILNQFVDLCGGKQARLVVIPTASAFAVETGARYCDVFGGLGAANVHCLDLKERQQANNPKEIEALEDATGIFMTGGDQVKLVSFLGGTLLGRKISSSLAQGKTIGGTSAGASAMSQHMIAFGRSGAAPSQRMVHLAPGLGLTERVIIDQHFRQRDRLGRLMTAVALNPAMLGMGVDEDTALVINPDNQCEVVGSGSVTVVDGGDLQHTDIHAVKRHDPIAVLGVKVHVLTHGYRYDLNTRQPMPPRQNLL